MEKIGQVAAAGPGWPPATAQAPALWGPPLLLFCALGGGALLGWSAYQGQVEFFLALLLAGVVAAVILPRPAWVIMALISMMLLTYPDILQGRGLLTINNLLGAMLAILLLVRVLVSHDLWFLREREVKIFILLGLLFLISTAAAEYILPEFSQPPLTEEGRVIPDFTRSWLKDFFSRVAFVLFFVNFITTRRQVRYVLLTVLTCILVVAPPALEGYMSASGQGSLRVSPDKWTGSGWVSNPNHFAFMCLLGISLLFYFAQTTRRHSLRLCAALAAVTLTALALLAGSRSGFLGLLFLGAWLLTRGTASGRGLRTIVLLLGVSAAFTFFLLVPPLIQERLLNLNPFHPQGEGSHSTEVRTATLEQSFALFAQYPFFGIGLGNFRRVNMYIHGNFKPPHNSYVWALAEGGIFCLVLYLLLFSALLKRLRLIRQQCRADPELRPLAEWVSFYMLLFLFFSFFADVWLREIHTYLILGLSIVLQRLAAAKVNDGHRPRRVLY
ncbi:MAG: O-antigen ligase family protein [Deltaproteobacteria bacterium]|nr:O-antigen ligase family protein [Deltaproteobacteria bacterium]